MFRVYFSLSALALTLALVLGTFIIRKNLQKSGQTLVKKKGTFGKSVVVGVLGRTLIIRKNVKNLAQL